MDRRGFLAGLVALFAAPAAAVGLKKTEAFESELLTPVDLEKWAAEYDDKMTRGALRFDDTIATNPLGHDEEWHSLTQTLEHDPGQTVLKNHLDGEITEMRTWDRVLSREEIERLSTVSTRTFENKYIREFEVRICDTSREIVKSFERGHRRSVEVTAHICQTTMTSRTFDVELRYGESFTRFSIANDKNRDVLIERLVRASLDQLYKVEDAKLPFCYRASIKDSIAETMRWNCEPKVEALIEYAREWAWDKDSIMLLEHDGNVQEIEVDTADLLHGGVQTWDRYLLALRAVKTHHPPHHYNCRCQGVMLATNAEIRSDRMIPTQQRCKVPARKLTEEELALMNNFSLTAKEVTERLKDLRLQTIKTTASVDTLNEKLRDFSNDEKNFVMEKT